MSTAAVRRYWDWLEDECVCGAPSELGGERQFLQHTGWDLVHRAVLNRHNWEVKAR